LGQSAAASPPPFSILETTIADVHEGFGSGRLTARDLVEMYLDRIEAVDKRGPTLNSIITINARALDDATQLDASYQVSGLVGPLHGIPVFLKDQIDARGMPTTMGSILFRDYRPDRDAFVVEKLRAAGAVILGKTTLGELGGGDTHGSLFGSTRNPYALDRTVGGSSGGSAASVAANLATVAVGQEGLASIRRPAAWTSIVGMRPSGGLVSRSGVYDGWPKRVGSLGPMARTVRDAAILLQVLVGYDAEDPLTATGYGKAPDDFLAFLDPKGLEGARIGVLREPMGLNSDPDSADFKQVAEVFERAVSELRGAGAALVDPIEIPRLKELLATRAVDPGEREASFRRYVGRGGNSPYQTWAELLASASVADAGKGARDKLARVSDPAAYGRYLSARDELMVNVLSVMADHGLDAIVHRSVEHQPTLIEEALKPPYVSHRGAPHLNTFLVHVPSITVPAGFTSDGLPAGITFLGRPYEDGGILRLAYAYEQATFHRRPPSHAP
jgi:Asp-tRNA(Asn)/Glu-tRNA(Gln) amidotransferase A subunit family amidase